jgi:hypothetical protein
MFVLGNFFYESVIRISPIKKFFPLLRPLALPNHIRLSWFSLKRFLTSTKLIGLSRK